MSFTATLKELIAAMSSPNPRDPSVLSAFNTLSTPRNVIFLGATKFRLALIKKKIFEAFEPYDEAREEKMAGRVKTNEETGEFLTDGQGNWIYNCREDRIEFNKDLGELQKATVEFEGSKLTRQDLMYRDTKDLSKTPKCAVDLLSPDDALNLFWLLDDSCFVEEDEAKTKPKRKAATG